MASFLAYIFIFIVSYILYKAYRDRKIGGLFNPIVFFCIYYTYYIIYPFFTSESDIYGALKYDGRELLLIGAILSILSMYAAFNIYKPRKTLGSNYMYLGANSMKLGLWLSIIGILSYFVINGFSINVLAIQNDFYDATQHRLGHAEEYISLLVSLLPAAACLLYAASSKWIYIVVVSLFATVIGLMDGSRYLIFMYYIPLIVFYHIYPNPKKVNLKIWVPTALFFILAMGVIEKTRNYGSGLDIEKLNDIFSDKSANVKATETEGVYYFSSKVMDAYQNEPLLYGDVFGTALCLPIPRSLFPEKPDAKYLVDANIRVLGSSSIGAAYLNIVEWYIALGWIGIILNGVLLGILSKFFWCNYIKSQRSIGGAMYLAIFDGLGYILVSRGYLAQEYVMFVYYLPMIYWISSLVLTFSTRKKTA